MIVVHGFALYGRLAASTRYRLEQYVPGLALHGVDLRLSYLLDDIYLTSTFKGHKASAWQMLRSGIGRLSDLVELRRFNAAIVHCELLPLVPGWLEAPLLYRPFLYDFDDAFYLRYRQGRLRHLDCLLGHKFDAVIKKAAAVTAGNGELARYASRFNVNTEILPTVVDTRRYRVAPRKTDSIFTVGWIGSPSTAAYLNALIGPLSQLALEGPVRVVVVGARAPVIVGVEVIERAWREDTEVEQILAFDVGVMPLPDDDWARGKCAFKLIQYMACGIPVVASAVGANKDVVAPDCGFLVEHEGGWVQALRALRDSPDLRGHMGASGRHRVEGHYSLEVALPKMAAVLTRIATS